jgi:hypothetical protein
MIKLRRQFVQLTLLSAATTFICALPQVNGAAFQNLDFESVILPLVSTDPFYGRVPISNALPGWTGHIGSVQQELVLYNNVFLDSTGIGLFGPGPGVSGVHIEGSYTAFLEAGFGIFGPELRPDANLSQTGLIPFGTRSFLFKGLATGPFVVSLNNQAIPMLSLSSGPNYTLYGGDVSIFAGSMAELQITLISPASPFHDFLSLDSVEFSPNAVPEPSFMWLLGIGLASAGLWRLRRSSKT